MTDHFWHGFWLGLLAGWWIGEIAVVLLLYFLDHWHDGEAES